MENNGLQVECRKWQSYTRCTRLPCHWVGWSVACTLALQVAKVRKRSHVRSESEVSGKSWRNKLQVKSDFGDLRKFVTLSLGSFCSPRDFSTFSRDSLAPEDGELSARE